jgi:hypothetical protein
VILYPQLNYIRPAFLVLTLFIYWISYEALGDRSAALSNAEKALQKLETAKISMHNLRKESGKALGKRLQD